MARLNVAAEMVALPLEDPFAIGVELEHHPRAQPRWTCRLRRDRPIHLTVGQGPTAEDAINDLKRLLR